MGTMDEHEACEAGQTVPIKVAGRTHSSLKERGVSRWS